MSKIVKNLPFPSIFLVILNSYAKNKIYNSILFTVLRRIAIKRNKKINICILHTKILRILISGILTKIASNIYYILYNRECL